MADVHATAIVESGAELAVDVTVGAYAYVGHAVRLGPGCVVHHHGVVDGHSTLGSGNEIFPFAFIGGKTQDLKYDGSVCPIFIGNGNVFREYVTVNGPTTDGGETRIGDRNYFLSYSHVAHECRIHDDVIVSSKAVIGGHVEVESFANIGGASAIHQFCRVGRHALLGGLSALVHDLPPYMIAEGNRARVRAYNCIGLRRRGFDEKYIEAVRRVFRHIYGGKNDRSAALKKIDDDAMISDDLKKEIMDFFGQSRRGTA
ncbi:MAG: acyl-ACP--UDP-N-acetylglucosamine O-acyltransferase [Puniceicoccales bacterium]|jgi:UDP-N-acetylglucosamine acyltransferase|nr:acyl-ACP--UDP-N-acetylglucosamine O-acyltransferase [Puniceicoccales bacterium]